MNRDEQSKHQQGTQQGFGTKKPTHNQPGQNQQGNKGRDDQRHGQKAGNPNQTSR